MCVGYCYYDYLNRLILEKFNTNALNKETRSRNVPYKSDRLAKFVFIYFKTISMSHG